MRMVLTPTASERAQINLVLGFSQARTVRERARRVGNSLQLGLRGNVLLNLLLQASVVLVDEPVYDILKDKGSISSPSEEIYY